MNLLNNYFYFTYGAFLGFELPLQYKDSSILH